jgi:ABC-type uncharacterized transport system permease subunit
MNNLKRRYGCATCIIGRRLQKRNELMDYVVIVIVGILVFVIVSLIQHVKRTGETIYKFKVD